MVGDMKSSSLFFFDGRTTYDWKHLKQWLKMRTSKKLIGNLPSLQTISTCFQKEFGSKHFPPALGWSFRFVDFDVVALNKASILFLHLRSFSGFLNCLDGLGAPDDVVIFMTTNHPDKLVP